jgi:hypothetical protein
MRRLGAGLRALAAREQVGMRWMNEHLLEFFLLDVFSGCSVGTLPANELG